MKTLQDLERMKNEPCEPFRSKYDYFLSYLENSYISKIDGIARIKCALAEWDERTREHIVDVLSDMLLSYGLENFDAVRFRNEILL